MIRDALKRKDIVTASTPTVKASQQSVLNQFGVNLAHDYSVLDAFVLKDASGAISDQLILVRNPWAEDSYNGTFSN